MRHRDLRLHGVFAGVGIAVAVASSVGGFYELGLLAMSLPVFASLNLCYWKWTVFPYDCILSAWSDDGLHWVRDDLLRLDVGGVSNSSQVYHPDIIDVDGGYRMYFRGGDRQSVILSAFSSDGLAWREEPGCRLGERQGLDRLVSSEIVALQEGYRLYFAAYAESRWKMYWSESVDGLTWGRETCCLDAGPESSLLHVQDPSVIVVEGQYRMFFMHFSAVESHIYTSTSLDGYDWSDMELCTGYRDSESSSVRDPNVVSLPGGGWRMYFSETVNRSALNSRIASAISDDGRSWRREEGYRLEPGGKFDPQGVFCPDVVREGEGWRMYYGGYWKKHFLAPYTKYCHRLKVPVRTAL
jgi:predicted GH43/DUF377 family glycosyl hydrolase